MDSCGGTRNAKCFHSYHAWVVIIFPFLVSTHYSCVYLSAEIFVLKPHLSMLNVSLAMAVLSFHMFVATLLFKQHMHLSVLGYGALKVW